MIPTDVKQKPIPGFPNYVVTDDAQVYNIKLNRKVKQFRHKNGRRYVSLFNRDLGKGVKYYVSRLVAAAFVKGKTPLKNRVLYKDGNKDNPLPSNLYWGTHQTAIRKGKQPQRKSLSGEANHNSKLTQKQVKEIRRIYATGKSSHRLLSLKYKVTTTAIYKILKGKMWANIVS